jgi:hypothetical protein
VPTHPPTSTHDVDSLALTVARRDRVRDAHLNMQVGSPDHIDEGIEAKQFDLAGHEIGDARLGHTKQLGGLRLLSSVRAIMHRFSVLP